MALSPEAPPDTALVPPGGYPEGPNSRHATTRLPEALLRAGKGASQDEASLGYV